MPLQLDDSVERNHLVDSQRHSNKDNCVKESEEIYIRTSVASFFERSCRSCSIGIISEFRARIIKIRLTDAPYICTKVKKFYCEDLRTKSRSYREMVKN